MAAGFATVPRPAPSPAGRPRCRLKAHKEMRLSTGSISVHTKCPLFYVKSWFYDASRASSFTFLLVFLTFQLFLRHSIMRNNQYQLLHCVYSDGNANLCPIGTMQNLMQTLTSMLKAHGLRCGTGTGSIHFIAIDITKGQSEQKLKSCLPLKKGFFLSNAFTFPQW